MSVSGVPGGEPSVPPPEDGELLPSLDTILNPDEFFAAFGPGIPEDHEENGPAWERDLRHFAASHQSAVINSALAYYNPSTEAVDAATEAIALATKNSMALMDREYFRELEPKAPDGAAPLDEALKTM